MNDLSYDQRLKLGAIHLRRELADAARKRAVAADLMSDGAASAMLHAEADQHEAAIIVAVRALADAEQVRARDSGRAKVTPIESVKPSIARAA